MNSNNNESAGIVLNGQGEDWVERAALGASALCLIHCLALPLILAALPTIASVLAIPESFHLWILALALPSSAIALYSGRLRHGTTYPAVLGAAGLAMLAAGAVVFAATWWDTPVTVVGSLLLATAHLTNWRLRHAHHGHG
ncbi:MerC domain-containing protein [uncultured Sphingomonas sp.]|uniref:MerC domain-containing protein n=1 Tax=uncultured Sphingomonas sp. TaxID=158754 RepID=UPI0035CAD5BD